MAIKKVIPYLQYQEYVGELKGIAEVMDKPLVDIFLLNLIYELRTACTAIVYRNKDGTIEFAKNLDFPFLDRFPDLNIDVAYKKGGQVIFRF